MTPARKTKLTETEDHDEVEKPTRADFEDHDDPERVAERYYGSAYRDPGSLDWIGPDE